MRLKGESSLCRGQMHWRARKNTRTHPVLEDGAPLFWMGVLTAVSGKVCGGLRKTCGKRGARVGVEDVRADGFDVDLSRSNS